MSDDLVTRLRRIGERVKVPCPDEIKGCLVFHYRIETDPTCAEAADEIERLRDALELMRDLLAGQRSPVAVAFLAIIRAALNDKGEKP